MKRTALAILLGLSLMFIGGALSGCAETSPYQNNPHLGYGM